MSSDSKHLRFLSENIGNLFSTSYQYTQTFVVDQVLKSCVNNAQNGCSLDRINFLVSASVAFPLSYACFFTFPTQQGCTCTWRLCLLQFCAKSALYCSPMILCSLKPLQNPLPIALNLLDGMTLRLLYLLH